MDVVVSGAGIAGLATALHLAKGGHAVTVLERDPAPPEDADAAWDQWERRGVPQLRLAHVFLSRMRNLIRDEHPELYASLHAAGATEMTWYEALPSTISDRTTRPIDDDLAMLGVRRSVIEQHLRSAAALAGADIRSDAAVVGVVTGDAVIGDVPHVTGVRLADGTTLGADLVVDCGGRRSALPEWLSAIGARPIPEREVEDGLMYFGRYYKLEEGASYPMIEGGPIVDVGYLFGLTFRADAGWFAIALAVHNEDKAMRALRDEDVFEAALQAIPGTAKWRQPGQSRPMTEVKSMARIDDRWRDYVVDGSPVATGLVPLGDSLVATNPALGRGSSLAWVAARELAAVLADTDDPARIVTDYDAAVRRTIQPWFEQTAQMDTARFEQMRRILAGEPEPVPDEGDPAAAFSAGFQLGSRVDPDVYRAMGQVAHLLKDPMELLGDPDLAARVIDAYERRDMFPPAPLAVPTREELLAAMAVKV